RDLRETGISDAARNLDRPLLILHSPEDELVELTNANGIFRAARHPKSFIALDGANHLLTKRRHARRAAQLIAAWADPYLPETFTQEIDGPLSPRERRLPGMSEMTAPEQEVVRICRDLLRIDTSNYGPGKDGPGEREAADYVVAELREVGLEPEVFESEPRRPTVAVRGPGVDRERGGLCIHGHLDVVPAHAEDWAEPPFDAVERDGCLWGRGAVDMKDMVA